MFKNTAGQKITYFEFTVATGLAKTGDGANLSAYVSIDDGPVTALASQTAVELSASNAAGLYSFPTSQAETNGNKLVFTAKSTTPGVSFAQLTLYTIDYPAIVTQIFQDLTTSTDFTVQGSIGQLFVSALTKIGTGQITVLSAVQSNGDVMLVVGDDYFAAEGRALQWMGSAPNEWPDMTGATALYFEVDHGALTVNVGFGGIITATGTQEVQVELTSAQTSQLRTHVGIKPCDLRVLLADGHLVTLLSRKCTIIDNQAFRGM